jgi:hypothetical protein
MGLSTTREATRCLATRYFPALHGTRRFNTEFTRALHLFLSLARPIQSTSPHPTSPRSILIVYEYICRITNNQIRIFSFPSHTCCHDETIIRSDNYICCFTRIPDFMRSAVGAESKIRSSITRYQILLWQWNRGIWMVGYVWAPCTGETRIYAKCELENPKEETTSKSLVYVGGYCPKK